MLQATCSCFNKIGSLGYSPLLVGGIFLPILQCYKKTLTPKNNKKTYRTILPRVINTRQATQFKRNQPATAQNKSPTMGNQLKNSITLP